MDFKIKADTYNPLLKRKEVNVEVPHEGEGTPSRVNLREAVAAKYNTKPENVYVVDVETKTGTQSALCEIEVYDDLQIARRTVPKHIQVRNMPVEERKRVREEEAKKEEAKPKAEKPKAAKPTPEPKEGKPKQEAKPSAEPPKKSKESETK